MRSAVVVGAGVGGLAVAGALTRPGWQVTLLERGDRLRGDSAALVIWPNGVRALHALGLGGGLSAIASAAPGRGVRRPNGQWLVQPDKVVGGDEDGADDSGVVHPEGLHDTLLARLRQRSEVRPRGGGRTAPVLAGGVAAGGLYGPATVRGPYRAGPPAPQLARLRGWSADWPPPIADILAATEPDDLIQHATAELRPIPRAFAFPSGPGGFVLLGDAAHAMSHHLGQGACLALEDAATLRALLLDAIPGRALVHALEEYTGQRRPRVARIVRQSRRVGAVYAANGNLVVRARNAALGLTPRLLGRAGVMARQWRPPG